jgi:virulence-associated protein VagC
VAHDVRRRQVELREVSLGLERRGVLLFVLRDARRAQPLAARRAGQFRSQAVRVPTGVASVAQQEILRVVAELALRAQSRVDVLSRELVVIVVVVEAVGEVAPARRRRATRATRRVLRRGVQIVKTSGLLFPSRRLSAAAGGGVRIALVVGIAVVGIAPVLVRVVAGSRRDRAARQTRAPRTRRVPPTRRVVSARLAVVVVVFVFFLVVVRGEHSRLRAFERRAPRALRASRGLRLGCRARARVAPPLAARHAREFRSQAVRVPTAVASVAQDQPRLVVALAARLTHGLVVS